MGHHSDLRADRICVHLGNHPPKHSFLQDLAFQVLLQGATLDGRPGHARIVASMGCETVYRSPGFEEGRCVLSLFSSSLLSLKRWRIGHLSGCTRVQAFFALMGGCVSESDAAQNDQVTICSPYHASMIKMPPDEEILDKSKRDSFVKYLALVQILWFAMNTIYRIQSRDLFATEAEIVTLTFAGLSAITNWFWLDKPKGINIPLPYPRTTLPPNTTQNCFKWAISKLRSFRHSIWRGILESKKDISAYNCVTLATSMLDSCPRSGDVISKSEVYAYDGDLSDKMTIPVLCASFFGSLYGITHLTIASLNGGLTHARGRIWFSFALLGSALSFYLLLAILISICLSLSVGEKPWVKKMEGWMLNKYVGWVFLFASVIGRMGLIGVLIYFMFSPYDYRAFLIPKWSQYIPHPF